MNTRILLLFIIATSLPTFALSFVIGIDFGSEWFKVAVVKPKTGLDIVLNEQSSRKTASAVALLNGELTLGTDAKNLITRSPKGVYTYPGQLLGRQFEDKVIQDNRVFYPFNLEKNEETGGFQIPYDENITFIPETIAGFLLSYAKEIATKSTGLTVKDCVITVPPYFTQYQRQSIIDAAKLAGLSVLSLMNENTAGKRIRWKFNHEAALYYGIEQNFENDTYAIIYDMGTTSLSTTLLTFKSIPDPSSKKNVTIGQLTVNEVAWDQTLGGRDFDLKIAYHLADIASKALGEQLTPTSNARAFAKLLKAAQKAKEVLSANIDTLVSVEGLVGDYDLQTTLTREQFERMSADLFKRAIAPLDTIFSKSNITKEYVSLVEIVGGGVRVPKLQQVLADYFGRTDLDKHINGDEGTVLGAAFYAATKSSSFKVKEFKLKDITTFDVNAKIQSDNQEIDKSTDLFTAGNRLGSKKSLTFSSNENFTVTLSYAKNSALPPFTRNLLGSYYVSGLPTTEKYNFTGKPKVHVNFRLNHNGIVVLEDAEAEITIVSLVEVKPNVTAAKTATVVEEKTVENSEGEAASEPEPENKGEEAPEAKSETENSAESSTETKTEEAAPVFKEVSRVHTVRLVVTPITVPGLTKEMIDKSDKITREINRRVELKREKEREKNSLEAYIYASREKLEQEDVLKVSTQEQRDAFNEAMNQAGDWLYGEGADTTASEYRTKLSSLKNLGEKIFTRAKELTELPKAAVQLWMQINSSRMMMENITNRLEVEEEEKADILETCDEMADWLLEKLALQKDAPPHEEPVITSFEIERKIKLLDSQTRLLVRRPRKKPPKVEVPTNSTTVPPTEEGTNTEAPTDETKPAENTEEPSKEQEKHDEL